MKKRLRQKKTNDFGQLNFNQVAAGLVTYGNPSGTPTVSTYGEHAGQADWNLGTTIDGLRRNYSRDYSFADGTYTYYTV